MKITINKQIHQLPTSWEDLSSKQQNFIVKILKMDSADILQPQELLPAKRMLLVQNLLNLDIHFMREWERSYIDINGQLGQLIFQSKLHEILQSAGFLFKKTSIQNGREKYHLRKGLKGKSQAFLKRKKKGEK